MRFQVLLDSRPQADEEPRSSPTTRPSVAGDEEHSNKKAKMSPAKKLRIDRVTEEMASCIRVVKVGEEELYTIDEPDADPGDRMRSGWIR